MSKEITSEESENKEHVPAQADRWTDTQTDKIFCFRKSDGVSTGSIQQVKSSLLHLPQNLITEI